MKKYIILILVYINLYASISLKQDEYRFNLLNQKLNFNYFGHYVRENSTIIDTKPCNVSRDIDAIEGEKLDRIYTFKEILNLIETQYGYHTYIKADEIDLDKRFVDLDKEENIGAIFNKLLAGTDCVADIDESKHAINITYASNLYMDLPYNWDMKESVALFRRTFPYVRFYVAGNRLVAYGLKKDITKVARAFKKYQKDALKEVPLRVIAYPYCTNVQDNSFIAKRKFAGSERFKPLQIRDVILSQGDHIDINYKGISFNVIVDMQNRALIYKQQIIPFSDFLKVGIVFKDLYKKPKHESFLDKILYNFNSKKREDNECGDIIFTFNLQGGVY